MKYRIGFVSNSSTYSYLTYVPKDSLDEMVFEPHKLREFGYVMETLEEFGEFLVDQFELPERFYKEKDPDAYSNSIMEEYTAESIDRSMRHIKEFKRLEKLDFVALHVISSNETDEPAHYLSYQGVVQIRGHGGFEVRC